MLHDWTPLDVSASCSMCCLAFKVFGTREMHHQWRYSALGCQFCHMLMSSAMENMYILSSEHIKSLFFSSVRFQSSMCLPSLTSRLIASWLASSNLCVTPSKYVVTCNLEADIILKACHCIQNFGSWPLALALSSIAESELTQLYD